MLPEEDAVDVDVERLWGELGVALSIASNRSRIPCTTRALPRTGQGSIEKEVEGTEIGNHTTASNERNRWICVSAPLTFVSASQ